MPKCAGCHEGLPEAVSFCPRCGVPVLAATRPAAPTAGFTTAPPAPPRPTWTRRKFQSTAIVLALVPTILLGCAGIHRFYTGRIGTGILQLLTWGGLLIWLIYDVIDIANGRYRDAEGRPLTVS